MRARAAARPSGAGRRSRPPPTVRPHRLARASCDHVLVPEVDAVEVADHDHGAAEVVGDVGQGPPDPGITRGRGLHGPEDNEPTRELSDAPPRSGAEPRPAPRRGRRRASGSRGRRPSSTAHGSCAFAPPTWAQLGHPAPHVVAVGVELLALGDRVEDPEVRRGVGAGAGRPTASRGCCEARSPSTRWSRKCRAPHRPPDVQVLDQEAGRDHPHPVVHPAGREQLAHAGVDDRVAGPARPSRPRTASRRLVVAHRAELGSQVAPAESGWL